MQLEKIGRTTGWTTGTVSQTCHDEADGEGRWLICQVVSNHVSDGGDSGSPMFYWWWFHGTNTVQLVSLFWGGDADGRYSSPFSGVTNDLGSIDLRFTTQWQGITSLTSEYANDLGVGAGSTSNVWIVTNTPVAGGYTIKRWNGSNWTLIPNLGGTRIAVAPNGNAWVVTASGSIYRWSGSVWELMPGAARDIAVGANGSVWSVGTASAPGGYTVQQWNGANWTVVPGGANRISVDPSGNPWITAYDYTIWKWAGGTWQQISGLATDIGISPDGMPWVLGTGAAYGGYQIFWWSGQGWVQAPGAATAISADRGGTPWVANSFRQIFRGL